MFLTVQILIKRFSLALVTASICRVLFLVLNKVLWAFPAAQLAESFFFGLAYDISSLVYIHGIFIGLHLLPIKIFNRVKTQNFLFYLFMLGQFLFLFFNFIDKGLYPIVGRGSGSEIFSMSNETDGFIITKRVIRHF
jgi:hypothetical protein